jgi:hypothetical protein
VQTRLPPFRSIPVNDAALGGLIDRGDHGTNIFWVRLGAGSRNAFLHLAQAREDAAVAESAGGRLSGAFGSGACVSHFELENL